MRLNDLHNHVDTTGGAHLIGIEALAQQVPQLSLLLGHSSDLAHRVTRLEIDLQEARAALACSEAWFLDRIRELADRVARQEREAEQMRLALAGREA